MDKAQAQAFLDSIFPSGHMATLSTPTRVYFSGLIGEVPQLLPYKKYQVTESDPPYDVKEDHKKMAAALREIADYLEGKQTNDS